MIVSMKAVECQGKFKCSKKVQTIVTVETFEDYKKYYNNIMLNDVIVYNGDIDEYIANVTPDNAKNVFLHINCNPDIINLDVIEKMKEYNVMCTVPEGYNNMQQLYELNKMYSNIHFCGGNLLYINGVNIGLFEIKKVNRYIMTDEYSCQQSVIPLDEVDVDYEFVKPKGETVKIKAKVNKAIDRIKKVKVKKNKDEDEEEKEEKKQKVSKNKFKTGGLSMF